MIIEKILGARLNKAMIKTRMYMLVCIVLGLCSCTDYNPEIPNTNSNIKAFEYRTKLNANGNASEIYYYADEFIKDPCYFFSFKTSPKVVDHIIKLYSLKIANKNQQDEYGYSPPPNFAWWSKDLKNKSDVFFCRDKNLRVGYTLWYHSEAKICQFEIIYY